MSRWYSPYIRLTAAGLCIAFTFAGALTAQPAKPVTYRVIALAEPGQTIHQGFVDAAMDWLRKKAAEEGFAVDYIRTTDPIDEQFLAAHKVFIQLNYPPYRWTPVAEAAFEGDDTGHHRLDRLPSRVAARQIRRVRDVPLLSRIHGQHRLQELHP